jgi:hypothetical protein
VGSQRLTASAMARQTKLLLLTLMFQNKGVNENELRAEHLK